MYMLRQLGWILGLFVVLILVVFLFSQKAPTKSNITTQSQITTTPTTASYCSASSIGGLVNFQGAAGSSYGSFAIKNLSKQQCLVLGDQYIGVKYDTNSVKNLTITHMGHTPAQPFLLAPNAIIYSQVHYPNGAQCQSAGLNTTKVVFYYKISPTETVPFRNNQNGSIEQQVATCKSPSGKTEIQIWNMSPQPITQ